MPISFRPNVQFYNNGRSNKNFHPNNIERIIRSLNDSRIQYWIQNGNVVVDRDIHRSQMTVGNSNFWLKLEVRDIDNNLIPGLASLHIYLCFRQWNGPIYSNRNPMNNCIIPPTISGTDLPDVEQGLMNGGWWEFVHWTATHNNNLQTQFNHKNTISQEHLNRLKPKSSTNPAVVAWMKKVKENAKKQ